jgi:uncharacterized protein (TIGR03437 family)
MKPLLLALLFLASELAPAQTPQAPAYMSGYSKLLSNASTSSWSPSGTQIAYDQNALTGARAGYWDTWVMNADASGQTCLTCPGAPGVATGGAGGVPLPGLNSGNPRWSTDGKFLVFQAQCGPSNGSALLDFKGFPGSGWNNELWVTDLLGNFWQLTSQCGGNVGTGTGGVIYPTFSWDGTKLTWGQRIGLTGCGFYYCWELNVATWSEAGGVPSISGTTSYTPFPAGGHAYYYEPYGFSLDDSTVFFMGNLDSGMSPDAMNIYSFNLNTQVITDLTNTPDQWNEWPMVMPSGSSLLGNKIVYMSTTDTAGDINITPTHFECDLWSMNYDGSDQVRLTYFNVPGNPYYISYGIFGICLASHSWNPATNQLVVNNNQQAAFGAGNLDIAPGQTAGQMWLLDIEPANATVNAASYQNPPLAADAIVSTFGTNLANQTLAASNAALPTSLGNTTVSVLDAKGVARPASLYFVSPGQVNSIIPDGTGLGPAVVTVTNPQGVQSSSTVEIAAVSPAFYTMNQNGTGVVAAYVEVIPASGPETDEPVYSCPGGGAPCTTIPIDVSNPSDQFYLVMFGTGFRGRSSLQQVSVTIGTQSVPVLYAGAQGQYEGFDQMNVQLPGSLAGAGVVNVVATVDGAQANVVQIQLQ